MPRPKGGARQQPCAIFELLSLESKILPTQPRLLRPGGGGGSGQAACQFFHWSGPLLMPKGPPTRPVPGGGQQGHPSHTSSNRRNHSLQQQQRCQLRSWGKTRHLPPRIPATQCAGRGGAPLLTMQSTSPESSLLCRLWKGGTVLPSQPSPSTPFWHTSTWETYSWLGRSHPAQQTERTAGRGGHVCRQSLPAWQLSPPAGGGEGRRCNQLEPGVRACIAETKIHKNFHQPVRA
jgi:hypothetical protein